MKDDQVIMTVIPLVVGVLGTVPKSFEKRTGVTKNERRNPGHSIKESWRFEEACCHSDCSQRQPADYDVKWKTIS